MKIISNLIICDINQQMRQIDFGHCCKIYDLFIRCSNSTGLYEGTRCLLIIQEVTWLKLQRAVNKIDLIFCHIKSINFPIVFSGKRPWRVYKSTLHLLSWVKTITALSLEYQLSISFICVGCLQSFRLVTNIKET